MAQTSEIFRVKHTNYNEVIETKQMILYSPPKALLAVQPKQYFYYH